ncbi:retropepsin-like aspartic protease [Occallatibacter riparius]|uniref:Retropepsin-like domain-containing protein n=1 Tax=Occallatibacter riparius TaxID=1002689 RepID=A0A9J7BVK2_9BACT|nr:retropepsin-like aspartic protease [Occallatibacter riparius]UWZ86664.1 retropepsin-like domain-containing protein [Occallatibacter riparius]
MGRLGREAQAGSWCLLAAWAAMNLPGNCAFAQQTTSPAPQDQQQPGTGAQVHTGTNVGVTSEVRIRNLLADHQYFQVADELDQLSPEQAQFYRGLLANRSNDTPKSIELLEPLIDKVTASGDTANEKLLRKALAEDYLREGDWGKAAKAYETLESRMEGKLTPDEQAEIEMPVKMLPLAAANPPMTVDPCDKFLMQVSKNPLGLTDIPVFVDASPHSWMLDPTAPFNLVARSVAREVGLKVSDDAVTIRSLTGKPIKVHVTVIPRFTIGGRLTLRNMTAFVFDDADYSFPQTKYQVQGVLGYAALQALGSVKITGDATIEVVPGKEPDPATVASTKDGAALTAGKNGTDAPGAHFFLDGDQVIVALGSTGNERMFVVDAGGQQSYLTSRYYAEHASAFSGEPTSRFSIPSDPSIPPQPAYLAETVPLDVGGTMVRAHYLQVLAQPLGSAALDDVYGVLGIDVLDQLRSYTFDYRTMRFSVSPE